MKFLQPTNFLHFKKAWFFLKDSKEDFILREQEEHIQDTRKIIEKVCIKQQIISQKDISLKMQQIDASNFDIPVLKVTPFQTDFLEHRRCFELCARDMAINHFDEKEELCAKNCLSKHFQSQTFLQQKMHKEMTKMVEMSPNYQQMFAKKHDGPNFRVNTK